jgi:hypothetical protein
MANIASGTNSIGVALGSTVSTSLSGTFSSTMSGDDYIRLTQQIPTSAAAIALGNLSTLGAFLIKNLDPTNYVDILTTTVGTTFLHILPSCSVQGYFPSNITVPAAKANTATVSIEYMFCEV